MYTQSSTNDYVLHKLIPGRLLLQYYSTKSTKALMEVCCQSPSVMAHTQQQWHKETSWAGHEVSGTLLHAERQHGPRSGRASWFAALAVVAAVAVGATSARQHDTKLM